jgi:CRP-like cAMP-binding protein
MNENPLLHNIAKHIQLDAEEISTFLGLITTKSLAKRAMLLEAEQECRYLSYVQSGALRSFYIDKDGKEATIMFAISGWWITDMYCYLNKKPAMMHIEALEESTIFQLSRAHFDILLDAVPKFERFFRILMQNAYTREQLRIMENLSLSAEERYESFLLKYPQIVRQITQKQIASYLGITPEFLSSIRKTKQQNQNLKVP